MGSIRWRRNRRLKCECGGYWFPHRRGGGACDHSRTCHVHQAKRIGDLAALYQAIADLAFSHTRPLRAGAACPF